MNRAPLTPTAHRSCLRSAPFRESCVSADAGLGISGFEKPLVKTCFLNPETECLPLQEPVETAFRPLRWEHLTLPAGKFQRDLFFTCEFRVFSPAFSRLGLPPEFHRLADLPLVFTAIGEASGLVATSASGVLHEHDCGPLKPLLNECSLSPCDKTAPSRCSGTRHFFGLSP